MAATTKHGFSRGAPGEVVQDRPSPSPDVVSLATALADVLLAELEAIGDTIAIA